MGKQWYPITMNDDPIRIDWTHSSEVRCNLRVWHKGQWIATKLSGVPSPDYAKLIAKEMIDLFDRGESLCWACVGSINCKHSEVQK